MMEQKRSAASASSASASSARGGKDGAAGQAAATASAASSQGDAVVTLRVSRHRSGQAGVRASAHASTLSAEP